MSSLPAVSRSRGAAVSHSNDWGRGVRTAWTWTVAALAALAAAEAIASLAWRLAHDAPILAYAAHAMNHYGLAPYRDLFDFNLPGSYAAFRLGDALPGPLDLKFRVLDVAVLLGTALGLGALLAPFGTRAAVLGASLYTLAVLRFGAALGLQRETLALLPIVWACACVAAAGRLGRRRAWLLAGLGFGLAASIKPQLAIGLPVALVWSRWDERRAGSAVPRGAGSAAIGAVLMAALPLALGVAWVAARGALPAMAALFTQYVPLYLSLDEHHRVVSVAARWREAAVQLVRLGGTVGWLIPIVAALALGASRRGGDASGGSVPGSQDERANDAARSDRGSDGSRLRLLAAMAAAYAIVPLMSGQYWVYHWLPLACFLVALVAAVTGRAVASGGPPAAWALFALWLAIAIQVRPPRAFVDQLRGQPPPAPNGGVVDAIVARLEPLLQPGDTVQPLDWTGGAVNAMLRLDARPATRYLYDFCFYHHPMSPVIQALRADFVRRLDAAAPRFVVRILDTARPSGPGTTDRFPELEAVLSSRYRPIETRAEYELYERRSPSP